MAPISPALRALKTLEAQKMQFEDESAKVKQRCLQTLKTGRLATADQVARLHEVLCFMRAWPDDAQIFGLVEGMLDGFAARPDLRGHRHTLADSGIAGTAINFSFYAATAAWLAEHWPDQLHIDWASFENSAQLESYLSLLVCYSETPAVDSVGMEVSEWIERLKSKGETDAVFVIRRLSELMPDDFLRDHFYEELDVPLTLSAGKDTPSRTIERYEESPVAFQTTPFDRARPSLPDEIGRPATPARSLKRSEGIRLVDLAHMTMVTRHRDLDAFAYADPADVVTIDEDGFQFVVFGVLPPRRFLLETLYGYMVLKSGVPISYGAITALFNSAEVAYTIFDTFRGGESARVYARTLAMVHQLFGCDTFMIDPYQLGMDNDDALRSGAWWFYHKLGYRPRDKQVLKLMRQELSKMKARPKHRSSLPVLKRLATENVYLSLDKPRDDVMGEVDLANLGLKITDLLANRFGAKREQGERTLAAEAAARLDASGLGSWSPMEKLAWRRWAPLIALIHLDKWPAADKRALVELIRAKGGRQELDYLRRFDSHIRLRKAILRLAEA